MQPNRLAPSHRIWAVLLALLLPTLASARSRETVALHPLVVVGGEPIEEDLQGVFAAEVAKLDLDLVGSEEIRKHLQESAQSSCIGNDACLAGLAQKTHASRALLVTISPYSPSLILTGKVVTANGAVLRSLGGTQFSKTAGTTLLDSAQLAFREFLEALEVDALEIPPLAAPTPAATTPPQAPARPEVELARGSEDQTLKMAAYSCWGIGAATAAGAGVIAWTLQSDRAQLSDQLDAHGNLLNRDPAAIALDRSLRGRSATATGLLITAGVALATGTALHLLAPSPTGVSVSPSAGGGASVELSGRF